MYLLRRQRSAPTVLLVIMLAVTTGLGGCVKRTGRVKADVIAPRPADAPGEIAGNPISVADAGAWSTRTTRSSSSGKAGRSGVYDFEDVAIEGAIMGGSGSGGGGALLRARTTSSAPIMPAPPGGPVVPRPSPKPAPIAAGPLKAGYTDDNEDFAAFLAYLDAQRHNPAVQRHTQEMDVSDRRFVHVLDGEGRPVPGARINIVDEVRDRVVWTGVTYGDGSAAAYLAMAADAAEAPEGGYLVQVAAGDLRASKRWDGRSEDVALTLDGDVARAAEVPLDVVFLIDTTGSMGDEIARIKSTLLDVTARIRADVATPVDLRYGAVLYRDIGDAYLTSTHAFTRDVGSFDEALRGVQAQGGGDGPESLNQGLFQAVHGVEWREGAAKVVFMIADAPPHMDYDDDVPYTDSARAALERGIRVHSVAASGLDDGGSYVFRQVAQVTRGRFIFIEYGSTAASAADHGVTGRVGSNNLDAIIFDRIEAEIRGWGS